MLRKSVGFGVLALAGAALIPSSTVGAGGFHGGFSIHFAGPAGILRQPHAGPNTRPSRLGHPSRISTGPRVGGPSHSEKARLPYAPRLSRDGEKENPYAHFPRGRHRILFGGLFYPVTIGEDWGYVGTSYDPDEVPAYRYTPPSIVQVDPPTPQATPRLSSAHDYNQDACRSERVTVPAREGDREITIIRC
jgi:hypothetical protein